MAKSASRYADRRESPTPPLPSYRFIIRTAEPTLNLVPDDPNRIWGMVPNGGFSDHAVRTEAALRADGGTRTHTDGHLKTVPLPIGLRRRWSAG